MVEIHAERVGISLVLSSSGKLTQFSDYSLAFMRAPDYSRPSVDRPSQGDTAFQGRTLWQPYPESEPAVETDFGKFAHLQYDLHEVGADVASFIFGHPEDPTSTFRELEQGLVVLSQQIPWLDEGMTLNPHIMDLQYVQSFPNCLSPNPKYFQPFLPLDSNHPLQFRQILCDNARVHARRKRTIHSICERTMYWVGTGNRETPSKVHQ